MSVFFFLFFFYSNILAVFCPSSDKADTAKHKVYVYLVHHCFSGARKVWQTGEKCLEG